MSQIWKDGICKECGSIVIEMSEMTEKELNECADYKNMCSNPKCKEHKWHYVGDMEFLDYYEHNSKME